jgi:hypothetical protein
VSDQVSSLERDIEETRERLAATIDELTYRISPKTIAQREVASIKGYFVDAQGAPRQDNIVKVVGGVVAVVGLMAVIRHFVGD